MGRMWRTLSGIALVSVLAGCTSVEGQTADLAADLAAIEELHRTDERLSKAKDYEGLVFEPVARADDARAS